MNTRKYTILFIDDEENNLEVFRHAYFKYYHILTTHSTQEGARLLKEYEKEIHLVISDQRMPAMNGIEFLTLTKALRPEAVRMIISGYSDIEIIMQAFNQLEIFQYVLKPWNNPELKIVIDNALTKYQLTRDKKTLLRQLSEANTSLEDKVRVRTRDLEQRNKEYQALHHTKDKLFSIVSHDLRGPLASLASFLDLFLKYKGVFSEEETRKTMADIRSSLINMNEMMENVLSWAKSQMHEHVAVVNRFPAQELLNSVVNHYRLMAAQKEIDLVCEMPPGPIELFSDRGRLQVVFRNLLSNAIKFTPRGGNITLQLSGNQQAAVFSVSDSGIGMSAGTLEKLFSPRLSSTPGTEKEKGTGLGLLLCNEFIEKLGGKLKVESETGKGSSFSFTVPYRAEPAIGNY